MTKQNSKENKLIFYQERKGQSAIEYLMTYGWMLLVVAIVGGAIFATVSGQCLNDVSGFTGDNVEVIDYAASDDGLELEIQNMAGETVNLESIGVETSDGLIEADEDNGLGDTDEDAGPTGLSVGGSEIYDMTASNVGGEDDLGVSDSEACNDFDIDVTYERGDFDASESSTGTLQGNLELALTE